MPDQSTRFADSKYRRGAILGLTVAEIFILLLFLLMLVFLVLSQEQTEQIAQQEQDMRELQVFRETWQEPLAGIETPEEIMALTRLRDSIAGSQGNETEQLLEQLVKAEQERQTAETERQKAVVENERLLAESTRQQEALDEQQEHLEELQQQNERLHEVAEEQRILREKGQNPPCWYETVPAANGGTREKPFYLFEIAVFDEHMVVRPSPVPPGGATDDSDRTYAEEAAMLPLEEIRYGAPLSDNEVVDRLQAVLLCRQGIQGPHILLRLFHSGLG